jgi:hypothetical protein
MRPWTLAFGTLTIFLFVAACEDAPRRRKSPQDDDNGSGGSGAAAAGGASGSTTTTGGPSTTSTSGAGGAFTSCFDACSFVYDCGSEGYCPGFTGTASEKSSFVLGCTDACDAQPLLLQFVDPNDCAGTIANVSAVSAEFAFVCENGFDAPD